MAKHSRWNWKTDGEVQKKGWYPVFLNEYVEEAMIGLVYNCKPCFSEDEGMVDYSRIRW